jgi:tetratricopeptide (TPR) repeat protein
MTLQSQPADMVAVAPLVGNSSREEAIWLGVLLSRLLAAHLSGADLPVVPYDTLAEQLTTAHHKLPLDQAGIERLKRELALQSLIHGRYTLDDDGKMLGLKLEVSGPGAPAAPLEASAPLAGFGQFIERVALALIARLGTPIDEALRRRVRDVPRPAGFDAFRQLAQAYMAWAKGENDLALAAVNSALVIDGDLEEASEIEVAIARMAGDSQTTREAFRRWSQIAQKRKQPLAAAERLMLLGHWLVERGEWAAARGAYEDARGIFQEENDEYGQAQALNNLAHLDLLHGRTQAAIKTYRRTLRTFEQSPGGQVDVAFTFYNLALAHRNLGQRDEAQQAIERALALARRAKDPHLEARCLAQRGTIRDDLGQWAQASADYGQAIRLFDLVGDEKHLAIVKGHQAILFKQQGSYDRAEALLLEALGTLEQEGDPHEEAIVWLNLADLYFSMGLYDQAWTYAGQAMDTFEELKSGLLPRAKELRSRLEKIPAPAPDTGSSGYASTPPESEEAGQTGYTRSIPSYPPPESARASDDTESGPADTLSDFEADR